MDVGSSGRGYCEPVPVWVLGTEPGASARATSALIFKSSIRPAEL